MPSRSTVVAVIALALLFAACSDPDAGGGADAGAGGSGGGGGTGGCEDTAPVRSLLATGAPVRWTGVEAGHPARIAGAFPEASPEPVQAARSFLRRIGPDVGLAADDLEVGTVRRGLAGRYVRFGQRHLGLPVFDREVVVQVAEKAGASVIRQARLGHVGMARGLAAAPRLDGPAAIAAARAAVAGTAIAEISGVDLGFHVDDAGQRLAYRVLLGTRAPAGSWAVFVDARDGSIRERRDLLQYVDGQGYVFDPNPIASTGNLSLADNDDAPSRELTRARLLVTLPRLDGSGFLRGDWVDAKGPPEVERAFAENLLFDFDRSEDGFEQTMAYFHLDRTRARLEELGFTEVLDRPVVVNANASDVENSWFDPRSKEITTGTGGVDDGEDADVLVHEYGHAIQNDQRTSFGTGGDGPALGEGFGDYLAATIADTLSPQVIDPACLGEWNSSIWYDDSDELPCLRRMDGTRHYPEGLRGEEHVDGQIWSAVLWQLREALGADVVDRLVIESHFVYSMFEKYPGAAEALLEVDRTLHGGRHLDEMIPLLVDRGLLRTPTPPALLPDVLESRVVDLEPPRNGFTYADRLDHRQEIRIPGAAGLRLHFTSIDLETHESCIDGACDNLYLTNDQGFLFAILNGHRADVTTVVIPGEAVHLRLVTDRAAGGFGYRVDRVDVMGFRTCGNGARDGLEACEGADLGGLACDDLGFAGGTLACAADCRLDATACVAAPGCGDGVVGAGEECDGPALQGATCDTLGLGAGPVTCTAACRLDASACSTCGNGVREGAEACDGADVGGLACGDLHQGIGAVTCSPACTLDLSACVPDECL